MNRKATVKRKTKETDIAIDLVLDCLDSSKINSSVPFFDHMLASMSKHGRFYLNLTCKGDTIIDDHHSVEDIGLVLGQAFKQALGDKAGITRFSNAIVPMDDALSLAAIDLSGRPYFAYSGLELRDYISNYSEELTIEFMRSFASAADMNLHIKVFYGDNKHHIHESIFKAVGIALYNAAKIDDFLEGEIPSTKGVII